MAPNNGATLASMLDYSEDDLDMEMLTPESQTENKQPTKRKIGRPKPVAPAATKVAKSTIATRKTSGGGVLNKAMAATKKRPAKKVLAERVNGPEDGNDTEEVDDFDEAPPPPAKTKKVAKKNTPPKPAAKRGRKPKAVAPEVEKASIKPAVKGARGKRVVDSEPVIPESQPDPMDVEETEIPIEILETDQAVSEPVKQIAPRATTGRTRSISRQPDILPSRHRRGGSASDTERAGEPALRRKLGEVTKKFENLDLKYRSLKELGTTESQSNFDKLRKSADQRAKGKKRLTNLGGTIG